MLLFSILPLLLRLRGREKRTGLKQTADVSFCVASTELSLDLTVVRCSLPTTTKIEQQDSVSKQEDQPSFVATGSKWSAYFFFQSAFGKATTKFLKYKYSNQWIVSTCLATCGQLLGCWITKCPRSSETQLKGKWIATALVNPWEVQYLVNIILTIWIKLVSLQLLSHHIVFLQHICLEILRILIPAFQIFTIMSPTWNLMTQNFSSQSHLEVWYYT